MLDNRNGFQFYRTSANGGIEHFYPGDPANRPAYSFASDFDSLIKQIAVYDAHRHENNRHVATWTDEQGRTVYVFVQVQRNSEGADI